MTVGDELVATAFALSTHRKCMLVVDGPSDIDMDAFGLLHAQSLIESKSNARPATANATTHPAHCCSSRSSTARSAPTPRNPGSNRAASPTASGVVIAFDSPHLRAARIYLGDSALPSLTCIGERRATS
ncbi:hypothetical protein GS416_01525 [Rhodococcus hoagii]|nr:hypothetical protein [Prescottella equi]